MTSNKEGSIRQALFDKSSGKFDSVSQAAHFYQVPKSSARHRRLGRKSAEFSTSSLRRLSVEQECMLAQWISDLICQAMPPSYNTIRVVARKLASSDQPFGKKWLTKFKKRHPGLSKGRGRPRDLARLTCLINELIDQIYDGFEKLKLQYTIDNCDIWNMDETGFQMGQLASHNVMFDARVGPPLSASTGVSKWVSIIECINADEQALNPFLIHIGSEPKDA